MGWTEVTSEGTRRRPLPPLVRLLRTAERWMKARPTEGDRRRAALPAHLSAATLAGIGVLHGAWAAGVTWPAADRDSLGELVISNSELPGPAPTITVAAVLLATSGLVELRAHADHPVARRLPFGVLDLGVRVAAGVLAARGVAGPFISGRRATSPRYRRLDLSVYSPLCLALAAGLAHSAGSNRCRSRSWTGERGRADGQLGSSQRVK